MDPNKTTPGRNPRAPRPYIPYNDDPKNIGTLTGKLMPQNVRIDPSTEFENISEFFATPPGTVYGASSRRTVITTTSAAAGISGAEAGPSRRSNLGTASGRSLAALGGEDEEDGEREGLSRRMGGSGGGLREFGVEEDEDEVDLLGAGEESMEIDSPSLSRNTHSNSLSSRRPIHRPAPSMSPRGPARTARAISPDPIASPEIRAQKGSPLRGSGSGSGSGGGVGSPLRGSGSAGSKMAGASLNKVVRAGEASAGREEFGDALLLNGTKSKQHVNGNGKRSGAIENVPIDGEDDAGDDLGLDGENGNDVHPDETIEHPRLNHPSQRKSLQALSKRAGDQTTDSVDNDALEGAEQDGDQDVPMGDDGFDMGLGADEMDLGMDADQDAARPMENDEHDQNQETDVEMDEPEEDEVEQPVQSAGRKNAKVVKEKGKAVQKGRPRRPRERTADADDDGRRDQSVDPNVSIRIPVGRSHTRLRSKDQRHAPLQYWRCERAVFEQKALAKEQEPAGVAAWVTKPHIPAEPLRGKRRPGAGRRSVSAAIGGSKLKGRGRSESVDADRDPDDVTGWDDGTEASGIARNFKKGTEEMRRVAYPEKRYNPTKGDEKATFSHEKVFGEEEFFAAGLLNIEVDGEKTPKEARDNVYVFFVLQGCVEVTIHRTRFLMSERGMFMVPRGNLYGIKNNCRKKVKLYFAQARKISSDDGGEGPRILADPEGVAHPEELAEPLAALGGPDEAEAAAEAEEDDEATEVDDTPVKSKPRRGRPPGKKANAGGAAAAGTSLLKKATANASKKPVGKKR